MAFDDLRSFLQALDDHGQLLKISEEVNAEPDLAAAANATGRIGDGAPALWFDNIRGFIDARVAMNTIGSLGRTTRFPSACRQTPRLKKQIDEFIRRWDNFPIAPGAPRQSSLGRRTPSMATRSTCSIFCHCFV
ncbi:UbiD family decarboxylase [Escherichia coli]|nr:UbiD family decarboxylase [Escherichia coli]